MTLRDLVLKMSADEKLMVLRHGFTEWTECTPDEIINEYDALVDLPVATVWYSQMYKAIMVELE